MQEVDVESVALDPFPAVEEPPELSEGAVDPDPEGPLEGVARAHLVGDGADPADPRGDVGGLGVVAPPQERLEEPGRLEDPQLDLLDRPVADADAQRALPLDSREVVHGDRSFRHGASSFSAASPAARNAGAIALNVRKTRVTAGPSIPSSVSFATSDGVFGVSWGPKQP